MLTEFGKILAFFIFSVVFVLIALITAKIIAPHRPTKEKLMTYECGENPVGSPWIKFNLRFYVVALIFLIFDVEIVLLLPWAMVYRQWGLEGYAVGAIFLVLLILGMAYEWRKGDLEWERPKYGMKNFKKPVPKVPASRAALDSSEAVSDVPVTNN